MAEAICRAVDGPAFLAEPKRVKNHVIRSESILTPNKKYIEPCAVTYPPKFRFEIPDFQKNAEKRQNRVEPGKNSGEAYHQVVRLSSDCRHTRQIAPWSGRPVGLIPILLEGIEAGTEVSAYSVGISILSSPSGCCRS